MAENAIFVMLIGFLTVSVVYVFRWNNLDPRWLVAALAVVIAPGIYAAFTSGPFVPSARKRHAIMIKLAALKNTDIVYDLGCGDGRLVFEAAKKAKKAVGYELSVPLFLFGKLKGWLTRSRGEIRFGNLWKQDYSDADVIFCYLLPGAMKEFHQTVWPRLRPGTRVVSNSFPMTDLKPDTVEEMVYRYTVPGLSKNTAGEV